MWLDFEINSVRGLGTAISLRSSLRLLRTAIAWPFQDSNGARLRRVFKVAKGSRVMSFFKLSGWFCRYITENTVTDARQVPRGWDCRTIINANSLPIWMKL